MEFISPAIWFFYALFLSLLPTFFLKFYEIRDRKTIRMYYQWPQTKLCLAGDIFIFGDDTLLINLIFTFYRYDWHMDLTFYSEKVGQHCNGSNRLVPKHVPMVNRYHNHTNLTIQTWGKFILGFNEPDRTKHANMTPQEAADAWPLIEQNSHGAKLVSPAVASSNFHWYDEFFRLCQGCRVDFVAAHMYKCDANEIMRYLQRLYNRYNKKIWLTEFACPQTHDVNKQLHLMKTLLPRLEAADYVFRWVKKWNKM